MEEIHSIQILTTKITFSITRHKDSQRNSPTFLVPSREKDIVFTARDREEVFTSIAKLLKLLKRNNTLPQLNRIAIIVPDPLPYLYLAKQVFGQSGIPYQLKNGFPDMGEYQTAYNIVREADLLCAYDFDRCMIYQMYNKVYLWSHTTCNQIKSCAGMTSYSNSKLNLPNCLPV